MDQGGNTSKRATLDFKDIYMLWTQGDEWQVEIPGRGKGMEVG